MSGFRIDIGYFLLYLYLFGVHITANNITGEKIDEEINDLEHQCHLHVTDEDEIYSKVAKIIDGGSKLIRYNLTLPTTSLSPNYTTITEATKDAGSINYKSYLWQRVVSRHGQTLLTLAFNYDVLSLSMLSFGVDKIDINITESPKGCFHWLNITENQQIYMIRELIMNDFRSHLKRTVWMKDNDYACHQVIRRSGHYASFVHECCTRSERTHTMVCIDSKPNIWVYTMYQALKVMDFIFFFFAPAFVLTVFYGNSFRVANYIVKLKEPHMATIKKDTHLPRSSLDSTPVKIKKPKLTAETRTKPEFSQSVQAETKYYKKKYVECVAKIPCNSKCKVSMTQFFIQVDHKDLMTEKEVNVGLFSFLWSNLVLCNINKYQPFTTCCNQSIIGTWGRMFLCTVLPTRNKVARKLRRLNHKWRNSLSWNNVLSTFALMVFIALVPLPYYLRIIFFILYEQNEVMDRQSATEALNLRLVPQSNFFILYIPSHLLYLILPGLYFATSLMLLFVMKKNKIKFLEYVVSILQDVKHINRLESFRTLSFHFILPFEKFGICGFIIGPIYWIFALPVCIAIILYYCVPTLYLIGRFLVPSKPRYIDTNLTTKTDDDVEELEDQQTEVVYDTIEKAMFLSNISPRPDERLPAKPLGKDGTLTTNKPTNYSLLTKFAIGVLLSIWMVSLLILYSECFGFLAEVLTLTFMGAIVNAGSAGQYFMLFFFILTYSLSVLNAVHDKYQKLSSNVFEHIKEKLESDIDEAVIVNSQELNLAFKYFSKKELLELARKRNHDASDTLPYRYKDLFEIKERKLHWNVKNVILFLDKLDVPRIPRRLFEQIMNIQCPGCPGPLHLSLLHALARLMAMLFFLFFVVVVVMTFGDAYEISTTNQLLLTLAGGFVPFFIGTVLAPKEVELDLSSYSFRGKVHEIISQYSHSWPVYDLDFKLCKESYHTDVQQTSDVKNIESSTVSIIDETLGYQNDIDLNIAAEPAIEAETAFTASKSAYKLETATFKTAKPATLADTKADNNSIQEGHDTIIPHESSPDTALLSQGFNPDDNVDSPYPVMDTATGNVYDDPSSVQLYQIETETIDSDTDLVLHMQTAGYETYTQENCVIS